MESDVMRKMGTHADQPTKANPHGQIYKLFGMIFIIMLSMASAAGAYTITIHTDQSQGTVDAYYRSGGSWYLRTSGGGTFNATYSESEEWWITSTPQEGFTFSKFCIDDVTCANPITVNSYSGTLADHDVWIYFDPTDLSGYWDATTTLNGDIVEIAACVGNVGGYYKLTSNSGVILRSSILEPTHCLSSTESKSYLYSLEPGNWIAYSTLPNGTVMSFASFNVNPDPTPTVTPQPTITPSVTPNGEYSVSATLDYDTWSFNACAGNAQGYYTIDAPDGTHWYAVNVNANYCTSHSTSNANLLSLAPGMWTMTISVNDIPMDQYTFEVKDIVAPVYSPLSSHTDYLGAYNDYVGCQDVYPDNQTDSVFKLTITTPSDKLLNKVVLQSLDATGSPTTSIIYTSYFTDYCAMGVYKTDGTLLNGYDRNGSMASLIKGSNAYNLRTTWDNLLKTGDRLMITSFFNDSTKSYSYVNITKAGTGLGPINPPGYNPMEQKTEEFMESGMMVAFIILFVFIGAGNMIGGPGGMAIGTVAGVSFNVYYEMLPIWMLFLVAIITITAFAAFMGKTIVGSNNS